VTGPAAALLAAAVLSAVVDWWAVHADRRPVEYVGKPLTLALLTGAALALDPADPTVRAWFVVALALSLVGDVFLMLPSDRFVPGLASFLLAHVAYVVGFVAGGLEPAGVALGLAVVVAAGVGVGVPLLRSARRTAPALVGPVAAYMAVISAMLVCAAGSWRAVAIAGALLFYLSDALIGYGRFVRSHRHGRLAVMVTYHLGQGLLVLSLL
jgi:uncharacterized membrane protein YhhN